MGFIIIIRNHKKAVKGMLCDVSQLYQTDLSILRSLPVWLLIPVLCIWLLPLIFCLICDNKALIRRYAKCHNTLHTAFWLAVILALPCIGSLLWFAGSFLPYLIWKRRTGGFTEFPLTVPIPRKTVLILPVSWAVIVILQFLLLHEIPLISLLKQYDIAFETAFITWAAITVTDWFRSVRRPVLFIRLGAADVVAKRDLYGVPYFREENTRVMSPTILRSEARLLRAIADDLYRNHAYSEELVGRKDSFMNNEERLRYQVLGIRGKWLEAAPDFIEVRYIGRGITRCRVCLWYETDGERSCTETVLYRAVPKLTDWTVRSALLLCVQAAAGSLLIVSLHTGILELLGKLA